MISAEKIYIPEHRVGLDELPRELLVKIISYLNLQAIHCLEQVGRINSVLQILVQRIHCISDEDLDPVILTCRILLLFSPNPDSLEVRKFPL